MICYKGRVFCTFHKTCGAKGCSRALTDDVRAAARKWWDGPNPPIQVYVSLPECWIKPKEKEN